MNLQWVYNYCKCYERVLKYFQSDILLKIEPNIVFFGGGEIFGQAESFSEPSHRMTYFKS